MKQAVRYIIEQLKLHEIKIMRYDSYTSSSVYLKLDDGVLGSIRISNHRGKKHLRYKYNLTTERRRYYYDDKGVMRYFFPIGDIELLIQKILEDKQLTLQKYGESNYLKYMKENNEKGKGSYGFWRKGKYV